MYIYICIVFLCLRSDLDIHRRELGATATIAGEKLRERYENREKMYRKAAENMHRQVENTIIVQERQKQERQISCCRMYIQSY